MVLAHNECCLLRNRKGESEYQKDREPKSKKPEEANEKHQPCNICHKKGHSGKHCWYKDKPKVYEDHKDNNKIITKINKTISTTKGAENEELIDCKFAFTLEKEMNIVPSVNITILYDKKDIIEKIKTLVDTGSEVSLISRKLAKKLNWTLFSYPDNVTGITPQKIKIYGACYGIIAPTDEKVGNVCELLIVEDTPFDLLVGTNFLMSHKPSIILKGKSFQVIQGNKIALYLMRPCNDRDLEQIKIFKQNSNILDDQGKDDKEIDSPEKMVQLIHKLLTKQEISIYESCSTFEKRVDKMINQGLEDKQREQLKQLVLKYNKAFSKNQYDLEKISYQQCHIKIDIEG